MAKSTGPRDARLAKLTVLEKRLAKAKSLPELQDVAKQADVIAQAARRLKADRSVVNQAVDVLVESKVRMGELLGPPTHKSGPGRGKKKGHFGVTVLPKEEARKCRAAAWKVPRDIRERYRRWIDAKTDETWTFSDMLTLARLGDMQEPVIEALETGKASSITEAVRAVRNVSIVSDAPAVPTGKYRTIVVDPPWPMKKIERKAAIRQGDVEYATMSVDAIAEMPVPAHTASHCYLWTTQRFLPDAFTILEGWGFDYLVTMVWHKAGGFQPFDLPQYNCEFILLGRRGGLPFLDTKDFKCCFQAKRREHSRKPDVFYELVNRVSPAPRLDMFAREQRDGFEVWGNQTDQF